MLMISMLSGGRNSPCLITRVALGHWPEPVSHKNTHHDPCRQYHHPVLWPTTEITIMNMDFIWSLEMNMDFGKIWRAYPGKGYIGSSIPNLLKPLVKWYTGSNIREWALPRQPNWQTQLRAGAGEISTISRAISHFGLWCTAVQRAVWCISHL